MTTFQLNTTPQINVDFEIETATQLENTAYVSDSSGNIGQLNPDTQTVSNIVATGIIFTDIAINQAGELYGSTFSTLYQIDPDTGITEKIGHFCQSGINGLGFTSDGELYASSYDGGVFEVDITTGLGTLIPGTESFKSGGDIAFDADNNQFFGIDTQGEVYTISLDGTINHVGDTGFEKVWGLYMEDGNLFAQTSGKQQLLINQDHGAATSLGPITGDIQRIYGSTNDSVTSATTIGILTVEEGTISVIDLNATDEDTEGNGLTYSILGGEDANFFEIDSVSGQLSFINAPDFETPLDQGANNEYDLEVGVTDSNGLTGSQVLKVRVTDIDENEAPVICEPGHGAEAYIKVRENKTDVVDFFAIDDGDAEGAGLTYTITGGSDANAFEIDPSTGILTFKTAPQFRKSDRFRAERCNPWR